MHSYQLFALNFRSEDVEDVLVNALTSIRVTIAKRAATVIPKLRRGVRWRLEFRAWWF